jgi:hypothetical protein
MCSQLAAQPEIDWSVAFNRGDTSALIGAVYALDNEHVLIAGNGSAYRFGDDSVAALPFTRIYPADTSSLASHGVFVAKFNTVTNSIVFLTHVVTGDGGLYNSSVFDLDVDDSGNIYLVGLVARTNPEDGDLLPITDRLEGHVDGNRLEDDGLFVKLEPNGDLMLASYFGGVGTDVPFKVQALGQDRFAIAGTTSSEDFLLRGSLIDQKRGENDGFLQIYQQDNSVSFSSLIGGELDDHATALDLSGTKLVVGGKTNSPDFPVTSNAAVDRLQGDYDGWLVEVDTESFTQLYGSYYGGQGYNDIQSVEYLNTDLYIAGTSEIDDYFSQAGSAPDQIGIYYKRLDATLGQELAVNYYVGHQGSTAYTNYLSVSGNRVAVVGGLVGADPLNFPVINRLSKLNDTVRAYGIHGGGISMNSGFAVVWDSDSEVVSATQMPDYSGFGGTIYSADFTGTGNLLVGGSTSGMNYIDQTHSFETNSNDSIGGDYALAINLSQPKNMPPIAVDDVVQVPANAVDYLFSPLANDSDPDGEFDLSILGSFFWTSGPNHGSATDDGNGNMLYTPSAGFVGSDTIEYEIRDLAGEIARARISLVVSAPTSGGTGGGSSSQPGSSGGGGAASLLSLLVLGILVARRRTFRSRLGAT